MLAEPPPLVADPDQLLGWARSRAPADRERLLIKLIDLCASDPGASSAAVSGLMQDVLMTLVLEAERDIRRRMAEKLAREAWAPHALVTTLVLDHIDIARPLIAASPVLQDADLVRLLVEATIEHQIEVARRPRITGRVVEAILTRSEPAVLSALAANDTAELAGDAMARMVECSRRFAAMRAPLSRHPAMTSELAARLYVWVGESLRTALADRFQVDATRFGGVLREAVWDAHAGAAAAEVPDPEREEMERRLIAKLAVSGQLKPGYLLRALKERKASLFVHTLSALSGFSPDDVRAAMASDRPELLAYACVAVGLDKSVFATLLEGVRGVTAGHPRELPETRRRVDAAFQLRSADAARHAFRQSLHPPELMAG